MESLAPPGVQLAIGLNRQVDRLPHLCNDCRIPYEEDKSMIDPNHPDPYVDNVPHNPGDSVPAPEPEAEPEAPEWPEGQVPPEEQSDG